MHIGDPNLHSLTLTFPLLGRDPTALSAIIVKAAEAHEGVKEYRASGQRMAVVNCRTSADGSCIHAVIIAGQKGPAAISQALAIATLFSPQPEPVVPAPPLLPVATPSRLAPQTKGKKKKSFRARTTHVRTR